MNCAVHLDLPAVAACCACGGGVCPSCRNKMFGRNYCDVCAANLERELVDRASAPKSPPAVIVVEPPHSPAVAGLLSMVIPGAGQIYAGRSARGIGWLIVTMLSLPTVFLAMLFWPLQIFDAIDVARSENRKRARDLAQRP